MHFHEVRWITCIGTPVSAHFIVWWIGVYICIILILVKGHTGCIYNYCSIQSPTGLSPRTRLQWRRGADTPEGISRAQAVVMGERVYVDNDRKVFQYDWRRDTWSTLPDCPVKWFGMAQFLGKLITVGGEGQAAGLSLVKCISSMDSRNGKSSFHP